MSDLLAATTRLTAALAAENMALLAMDLAAAGAVLLEKQAATAAFEAARATPPARSAALMEAVERLVGQAAQNRRLLERAIVVQTRVIGVVVGAARSVQPAPRYGRSGAYAARPPMGWALSARA